MYRLGLVCGAYCEDGGTRWCRFRALGWDRVHAINLPAAEDSRVAKIWEVDFTISDDMVKISLHSNHL